MLAEGGRVRRTASGAGDNQLGRTLVEAREQARRKAEDDARRDADRLATAQAKEAEERARRKVRRPKAGAA